MYLTDEWALGLLALGLACFLLGGIGIFLS